MNKQYKEGTLAFELGNILMGEKLPIDIGSKKEGTEWKASHLITLAKEHEETIPALDPSPIKRRLEDLIYKWKESHEYSK